MKRTNKTLQLQIRVSPQEKAAICRSAKKASMGLSEWVLSKTLPPAQKPFQELLGRLNTAGDAKYVLAELHDLLKDSSGDELTVMVERPPEVSLPPYLANYVAAMVEYAAAQKGKAPPFWTKEIPPLAAPVFGSDLKNLKLHLLTHSPPPFRRRNIFIDSAVGKRI